MNEKPHRSTVNEITMKRSRTATMSSQATSRRLFHLSVLVLGSLAALPTAEAWDFLSILMAGAFFFFRE